MVKNRAQLTIFIIISILIVAVVVLFFTFRGTLQKEKPVSPETAEIQNFVQECLDESLESVVFKVGENGGYYFPPKVSTPVLEVPYYIKKNISLMPSKEDIGNEISRGVARELIFCLGDFTLFTNEYEITKGKINPPEVVIEPERVLIEMNYPLTIQKGDSKSKIEDFNSEVPVRLGIVYDAVAEFVSEEIKTKNYCVSCLLDILGKNDLHSINFDHDSNTKLFIIRDFNSVINEKFFEWIFANEY